MAGATTTEGNTKKKKEKSQLTEAKQIEWLESLDEALGLAEKRAEGTLVVEVPVIRYKFTIKRLKVGDINEASKRGGGDDLKSARQLFQLSVVPRPTDEQVERLF